MFTTPLKTSMRVFMKFCLSTRITPHCRRIVLRYICIHKSFLSFLRYFLCFCLHWFCFYCAVGVVCSGLLVGCITSVRGSFIQIFFHHFFLDPFTSRPHSAARQHLLFLCRCLPSIVSPRLPSLCEGLRVSSPPNIYIFHTHSIVTFTQLDAYSVAIRVLLDKDLVTFL